MRFASSTSISKCPFTNAIHCSSLLQVVNPECEGSQECKEAPEPQVEAHIILKPKCGQI